MTPRRVVSPEGTADSTDRPLVLHEPALARLLAALRDGGARVFAPVFDGDAVRLGEVASIDEVAARVRVEAAAGRYEAIPDLAAPFFAAFAGPDLWKRVFFPPRERVIRVRRRGRDLAFEEEPVDETPTALFGIPACDLRALRILDRVMAEGPYPDPRWTARRARTTIVTVQCVAPGANCFCATMGAGPRAPGGFDVALTEIAGNGEARFLAEAGSRTGTALLHDCGGEPATAADREAADVALAAAAASTGGRLDAGTLPHALERSLEGGHWQDVARKCLACGSCTLVCPTCFCTTLEDEALLDGSEASRVRSWDSCFSPDHSKLHGGLVRGSTASRYRQWLTHKLGSWDRQFGTPGCVGCGRCTVWCPAAIDFVQEARTAAGRI